tara:strand:+ start:643 stop:1557 length:915 start_codon:yes stop_codon:yes gene_type:complete
MHPGSRGHAKNGDEMTTQRRAAGANAVIAVRHGEWKTLRSHVFLNYSDRGEADSPHVVAYYFWAIVTPERTIVVDTGFAANAGLRRGRDVLISPIDAFVSLGLDPDSDVDLVLTHAHYDHIGNASWFRRARVYMARAEYDFWASPTADAPSFQGLVEETELAHLTELEASGRLRLIDADRSLAPGVDLVLAPGHTPGELMVRVDTADGVVLVTSDAVHFDEELARDMPFRHMCDLAEAHDTFRRIREMVRTGDVDHIVAGHEQDVSTRYPALPGSLGPHAVVIGGAPTETALASVSEREVVRDH